MHPMLREMLEPSVGWVPHDGSSVPPMSHTAQPMVRYDDGSVILAGTDHASTMDWTRIVAYKLRRYQHDQTLNSPDRRQRLAAAAIRR